MRMNRRQTFAIAGLIVVVAVAAAIVGLIVALKGLPTPISTGGNDPIYTTTGKPAPPTTSSPPPETPKSNWGKYRFAGVAADAAPCSTIGTEILGKHGGSAVDAAIATMLCVGLVNKHSTGIGGGSFVTIYDAPTKKVYTLDARETAPAAAFQDMFINDTKLAQAGGLAIATPGELLGYHSLHERFGKLPWSDLFQPAIRMCREGIRVQEALFIALSQQRKTILNDTNLREVFTNKTTGDILQVGDTMYNLKLAKTFETIAREGVSSFYNGSLAQDVIDDIQEAGGVITREDLQNYQVNWKEPSVTWLRNGNYTVYSTPPPGSGPIYQFILNIMDGYNLTKKDMETDEAAVLTWHRIVESFKFAYAKRTNLGDEDFLDIKELVANLTSKDYADEIRSKITDDATHEYMYYGPTFYDKIRPGTTHMSLYSPDGSTVAITSTINLYLGSKVMGSRTGILFNDEMDDFSTPGSVNRFGVPASPANFIKPGKRPLSSMTPVIILDGHGKVVHTVGASGGTKITPAMALVTMQNLWFGKQINEAVDGARLHHQLLPPYFQYEPNFPMKYVTALRKLGHNATLSKGRGSIVQAINIKEDGIYACADHRKGGSPDGY